MSAYLAQLERFRPYLEARAGAMGVRRREDREDLAQEAILGAWQHPWDGHGTLRNWLLWILRRDVNNWYEARVAGCRRLDRELSLEDHPGLLRLAGADNVEAQAADSLFVERYCRALTATNARVARYVAEGYGLSESCAMAGVKYGWGRKQAMRKRLEMLL